MFPARWPGVSHALSVPNDFPVLFHYHFPYPGNLDDHRIRTSLSCSSCHRTQNFVTDDDAQARVAARGRQLSWPARSPQAANLRVEGLIVVRCRCDNVVA